MSITEVVNDARQRRRGTVCSAFSYPLPASGTLPRSARTKMSRGLGSHNCLMERYGELQTADVSSSDPMLLGSVCFSLDVWENVPTTWEVGATRVVCEDEVEAEQSSRALRLDQILREAHEAGEISYPTMESALFIWKSVHEAVPGRLRVPYVDVSSTGRVLFTWDDNVKHLDIEIIPGSVAEFFYWNRLTDHDWEYDWSYSVEAGTSLPTEVISYLNNFRWRD